MKKHVRILAAVAAALLVLVAAGTAYLVDYALSNAGRERVVPYARIAADYPELAAWTDSLQVAQALHDTTLSMPSGGNGHAVFVRSPRSGGRTAVLVHGYKNTHADMLPIARIYERVMGYNILLPDLHGHGLSDGDDIQMGWKDRLDVLRWIKAVPGIVGAPSDSVRIVVHGVSMGAATTMCVSGEPTGSSVRCFVEDCGYTSAWDEFAHELRGRFSLPEFPLLYTASWLTDMRYGWSFGEASPLRAVARCRKPMLFIHGSADTFVPTSMVGPLYRAKPQPKELWVAPGSAHAMSYHDHKAEYINKVKAFVGKAMD